MRWTSTGLTFLRPNASTISSVNSAGQSSSPSEPDLVRIAYRMTAKDRSLLSTFATLTRSNT